MRTCSSLCKLWLQRKYYIFTLLAAVLLGALFGKLLQDTEPIVHLQRNAVEIGNPIKSTQSPHGDETERIQTERKILLRLYCQKNSHNKKFQTLHSSKFWKKFYLIDNYKKVIYAWIPKVMSTSMLYAMVYTKPAFHHIYPDLTFSSKDMKRFFGREFLLEKPKVHGIKIEKFGLRTLRSYGTRFTHHNISSYFKFVIVRDPYTRLASAYYNIIREKKSNNFWSELHSSMMQIYHPGNERKISDFNLTFSEFLKFITGQTASRDNIHWVPYKTILEPCNFSYDFIAKKETIEKDLPIIMARIDLTNTLSLKDISSNKGYTKEEVDCLYQSVDKDTIKRVIRKYNSDFKMFGYNKFRYLNDTNTIRC